MSDIIAPEPEAVTIVTTDAVSNSQAESIFENWNLKYRLEPAFPIADIKTVSEQQVRDAGNIANRQYVEEYYQQYSNGAKFPPIVLRANGALIDGNTRLTMWKKAKLTHVPVYLVELPSMDLALSLGTQLNQIGGVRLTPAESAKQALRMLEEGMLDEMQISRIVGRSRTQVTRWKQEHDFQKRIEKLDLTEDAARIPDAQKRTLVKVAWTKPFTEMVKLAGSRKIQNGELSKIVDTVLAAESEEAALEAIGTAALEYVASGPDGRVAIANVKARRMRMVLPQVLNLSPAEEFYDSARAEEDYEMWRQIAVAAEKALAMYQQYGAQTKLAV